MSLEVASSSSAHHLAERIAGPSNIVVRQRRMAQEHQARFTKLSRIWQALLWPKAVAVKGFFEVDLGTAARKAGNTHPVDLGHDAIPVPA